MPNYKKSKVKSKNRKYCVVIELDDNDDEYMCVVFESKEMRDKIKTLEYTYPCYMENNTITFEDCKGDCTNCGCECIAKRLQHSGKSPIFRYAVKQKN
jgi:hypothetical protein